MICKKKRKASVILSPFGYTGLVQEEKDMYEKPSASSSDFLSRMNAYENDKVRLAENKKRIRQEASRCLVQNGFKRKGNSLFQTIRGDTVSFFAFDHPSRFLYTDFCMYPLFMPPMKYLNLSIGNRMEHFIGPQMVLSDYATEQELHAWCKKIDGFIQDRVLPFIQHLETADQWLKYVSREDSAFSFIDLIRVSPDIRYELMMYAALACHQYDAAISAARLFLPQIDISCYTDDVRERGRRQYQELIELAQSGNDQAVDAFITERKIQNYRFFTGKELVP